MGGRNLGITRRRGMAMNWGFRQQLFTLGGVEGFNQA